MKCFRIDEGGEHFYYAAESAEQALAAYKEDTSEDFEGAKVREVLEQEMSVVKVTVEDDRQYPSGQTTLKQVFNDESVGLKQSALQLCSSVF